MQRCVITGGPGTGKTTLLNRLRREGYPTIRETARDLIAQEVFLEKVIPTYKANVPWTDIDSFQQLVLEEQSVREKRHQSQLQRFSLSSIVDKLMQKEPLATFQDRGVYDGMGYINHGKITPTPVWMRSVLQAKYDTIFICEPLTTYLNDAERKENRDEGLAIHRAIANIYERLGFYTIYLPSVSVEERLSIIHNAILPRTATECEIKVRVPDRKVLEERLRDHGCFEEGTLFEDDTYGDIAGILARNGYTLRLRQNGSIEMTIKGPTMHGIVNIRPEINIPLPRWSAQFLKSAIDSVRVADVSKERTIYRPLGDASIQISIDEVAHAGTFMEIEGRDQQHVLKWKSRLGITADTIKIPYKTLAAQVCRTQDYTL